MRRAELDKTMRPSSDALALPFGVQPPAASAAPSAAYTPAHRARLTAWILEEAADFHLKRTTAALAIWLLDRLATPVGPAGGAYDPLSLTPLNMQVLGCVCLYAAAKMEEIYALEVTDVTFAFPADVLHGCASDPAFLSQCRDPRIRESLDRLCMLTREAQDWQEMRAHSLRHAAMVTASEYVDGFSAGGYRILPNGESVLLRPDEGRMSDLALLCAHKRRYEAVDALFPWRVAHADLCHALIFMGTGVTSAERFAVTSDTFLRDASEVLAIVSDWKRGKILPAQANAIRHPQFADLCPNGELPAGDQGKLCVAALLVQAENAADYARFAASCPATYAWDQPDVRPNVLPHPIPHTDVAAFAAEILQLGSALILHYEVRVLARVGWRLHAPTAQAWLVNMAGAVGALVARVGDMPLLREDAGDADADDASVSSADTAATEAAGGFCENVVIDADVVPATSLALVSQSPQRTRHSGKPSSLAASPLRAASVAFPSASVSLPAGTMGQAGTPVEAVLSLGHASAPAAARSDCDVLLSARAVEQRHADRCAIEEYSTNAAMGALQRAALQVAARAVVATAQNAPHLFSTDARTALITPMTAHRTICADDTLLLPSGTLLSTGKTWWEPQNESDGLLNTPQQTPAVAHIADAFSLVKSSAPPASSPLNASTQEQLLHRIDDGHDLSSIAWTASDMNSGLGTHVRAEYAWPYSCLGHLGDVSAEEHKSLIASHRDKLLDAFHHTACASSWAQRPSARHIDDYLLPALAISNPRRPARDETGKLYTLSDDKSPPPTDTSVPSQFSESFAGDDRLFSIKGPHVCLGRFSMPDRLVDLPVPASAAAAVSNGNELSSNSVSGPGSAGLMPHPSFSSVNGGSWSIPFQWIVSAQTLLDLASIHPAYLLFKPSVLASAAMLVAAHGGTKRAMRPILPIVEHVIRTCAQGRFPVVHLEAASLKWNVQSSLNPRKATEDDCGPSARIAGHKRRRASAGDEPANADGSLSTGCTAISNGFVTPVISSAPYNDAVASAPITGKGHVRVTASIGFDEQDRLVTDFMSESLEDAMLLMSTIAECSPYPRICLDADRMVSIGLIMNEAEGVYLQAFNPEDRENVLLLIKEEAKIEKSVIAYIILEALERARSLNQPSGLTMPVKEHVRIMRSLATQAGLPFDVEADAFVDLILGDEAFRTAICSMVEGRSDEAIQLIAASLDGSITAASSVPSAFLRMIRMLAPLARNRCIALEKPQLLSSFQRSWSTTLTNSECSFDIAVETLSSCSGAPSGVNSLYLGMVADRASCMDDVIEPAQSRSTSYMGPVYLTVPGISPLGPIRSMNATVIPCSGDGIPSVSGKNDKPAGQKKCATAAITDRRDSKRPRTSNASAEVQPIAKKTLSALMNSVSSTSISANAVSTVAIGLTYAENASLDSEASQASHSRSSQNMHPYSATLASGRSVAASSAASFHNFGHAISGNTVASTSTASSNPGSKRALAMAEAASRGSIAPVGANTRPRMQNKSLPDKQATATASRGRLSKPAGGTQANGGRGAATNEPLRQTSIVDAMRSGGR
jgi:hypothetical protein